MILVYIGFGLTALLFLSFVCAIIIASLMDWHYYHKNKLFIRLKQDYSKPRRPAAK